MQHLSQISHAEINIIVHPSNTDALSLSTIKRVFLGKKKTFANGKKAALYVLKKDNVLSTEFNKTILRKSNAQLKSYWTRRIFTGKGRPPKKVSAQQMIEIVAKNPNAIGFIDSTDATAAIRVISY